MNLAKLENLTTSSGQQRQCPRECLCQLVALEVEVRRVVAAEEQRQRTTDRRCEVDAVPRPVGVSGEPEVVADEEYALHVSLLIPDAQEQATALATLAHTSPDEQPIFILDRLLVQQLVEVLNLPNQAEHDHALVAMSSRLANALPSNRVLQALAIQAQSGGRDLERDRDFRIG